jgi:hypothetical protein
LCDVLKCEKAAAAHNRCVDLLESLPAIHTAMRVDNPCKQLIHQTSPSERLRVLSDRALQSLLTTTAGGAPPTPHRGDHAHLSPQKLILATADIGIAMGTGTDVAMENAGVTLLKGDLQGIVRGRRLSSATMHNIRENLFFAFIYNAAGVPIAAGVLYPFFGVLLSPIIAAAAMALSSVSVILNSLRLRRVKVDEPTTANRFYSIVRNRKGTAWTTAAALLAISLGSILIAYAPKFLTPREPGPTQAEKTEPTPTQRAAPAPPAAATPPKEADSTAVKGAEPTTGGNAGSA